MSCELAVLKIRHICQTRKRLEAHDLLGHGDEESTRKTALEHSSILSQGMLKPCLHCAKAKAKKKNMCEESTAP